MQREEWISAPESRLALRVGITGHRPNRLSSSDSDKLRGQVRQILTRLRQAADAVLHVAGDAFAPGPPLLRVITPLAEGADRLVAEEALALGFEIQCPLPFPREIYERDFIGSESRRSFHQLLTRASAVLELSGEYHSESARCNAYQAVGRVLLAQSDVLLAIWSGARPEGAGGTGQVVEEATRLGVPTIWLHTTAPHELRLLLNEAEETTQGKAAADDLDRLAKYLVQRLRPPADAPGEWRRWTATPPPAPPWSSVYALFCRMLAGKPAPPPAGPPPHAGAPADPGHDGAPWHCAPDPDSRLPPALSAQIDAHFLRHFSWADRLATYYANRYRSSFVLNYLLSALAVLCSLLGYALGLPQERWEPFIVAELALICLIIAITAVGTRHRWHQRWMELRLLAEQLRQMRFLLPLGLSTPAFSVPDHHRHGNPQNTWGNWQLNAAIRAAGLLSARIDQAFLTTYARFLARRELLVQAAYHRANATRCAQIAHRVELASYVLFALTLLACMAHLLIHDATGRWLTLATAGLPAFGAAFVGILNQGEFQRIASRSAAMHERLRELSDNIEAGGNISLPHLASIAEEAAETMSGELLDWRLIFLKRRLLLPN